jgi:hypothetical protein
MSERIHPGIASHRSPSWEARLVLGSVCLLSGLAVADRIVAWLIGEFPTYALAWRIRFEFLRPIGVYYDVAELQVGSLSPATFSAIVLFAAALIAAGVVSRVRLARAISCHALLAAALILAAMSWDAGYAYGQVGMPSQPHAVLGLAVSLMATALCLRIHAEYAGWNPASSRTYRRLRIATLRLRARAGAFVANQFNPASKGIQTELATVRIRRGPGRRP